MLKIVTNATIGPIVPKNEFVVSLDRMLENTTFNIIYARAAFINVQQKS